MHSPTRHMQCAQAAELQEKMPHITLPALVLLPHVGEMMHINRLLAITQSRFVNELALQQGKVTAAAQLVRPSGDDGSAAAAAMPSAARQLATDAARPEPSALQLQAFKDFVLIMRSRAPWHLTLEGAVALLDAACFCSAPVIVKKLPAYFEPLFRSASLPQVRQLSLSQTPACHRSRACRLCAFTCACTHQAGASCNVILAGMQLRTQRTHRKSACTCSHRLQVSQGSCVFAVP